MRACCTTTYNIEDIQWHFKARSFTLFYHHRKINDTNFSDMKHFKVFIIDFPLKCGIIKRSKLHTLVTHAFFLLVRMTSKYYYIFGYIKLDGLSQIMSLLKHNDDPFENNWETTHNHISCVAHASRHMKQKWARKTIGNFWIFWTYELYNLSTPFYIWWLNIVIFKVLFWNFR